MGRRARVTRDEVLAAARDAFGERGYEGTTLAAIAGRVGVSPAALLRHAPTKDALFQAAMTQPPPPGPLPMAFLAEVEADADPRAVLRKLARTAIPFIEGQLAGNIARWMYEKSGNGGVRVLQLPYDPKSKASPPRRVLAMLEDYLRRAGRAGRIRVRDPRAAAVAFMGTMNAFVFFHRVLNIVDPPLSLDQYLGTVLDVWTRGILREQPARPAASSRRKKR